MKRFITTSILALSICSVSNAASFLPFIDGKKSQAGKAESNQAILAQPDCLQNLNGLAICKGEKVFSAAELLNSLYFEEVEVLGFSKELNVVVNVPMKDQSGKITYKELQLAASDLAITTEKPVTVNVMSLDHVKMGSKEVKTGDTLMVNALRPGQKGMVPVSGKVKILHLVNAGKDQRFLIVEKFGLVSLEEVAIIEDVQYL